MVENGHNSELALDTCEVRCLHLSLLHNLYGHLLAGDQVLSQLHLSISPLTDGLHNDVITDSLFSSLEWFFCMVTKRVSGGLRRKGYFSVTSEGDDLVLFLFCRPPSA